MVKVQFEIDAKKYFETDDESPANFTVEQDDFEGVVELWEELGKPVAEPNIIIMKEDFPNDGEAYVVGERMGRYFFAWGPFFPFADADELPEIEIDIISSESGIQWFETKEEAIQEYMHAVNAAEIKKAFDKLFNR